MKYKWLVAVMFVLVVGALIWVNLRNANPSAKSAATEGPKSAPLVKVTTIKARDMTQTVLAPGTLEVTRPLELRAPFATTRVHLLVGAGDKVKQGDLLVELQSDEMQVQVTSQEAAVQRSQSTLAQLNQQRDSAPLQLSQKVEAAKAQLIQAQSALESATRAPATARQRVQQAEANLLAVQNRAAGSSDQAGPARDRLQTAEAAYRANPADAAARQAYDDARTAYEAALRSAADAAKQTVADLAQARQSLEVAQSEFEANGTEDSTALAQARQAVTSARIAVDIATKDAETGGVLIEQIQSAEADLAAARASLENSRAKLAQAAVKAPRDGVVLTLGLKDGQPAQQQQLLLELGNLESLTIRARVDEVDIGKVKPGQPLSIRTNAYLEDRFTGKVTRVAAQSLAQSPGTASAGTAYEVEGEVTNQDGKLRGGMSAQTSITTDKRTGVFVVGLESVREENGKAFVLVAKDFKIQLREVKLGLRTQTQAQVVEGLSEGDKVVASPFTFIKSAKEGDPVRVDPAEITPSEEQS